MAHEHLSSNMSFDDLMLSLHSAQDDPLLRLHETNRKIREAAFRMRVANSRVKYSLMDLEFDLAQFQQKHPELGLLSKLQKPD